jgi:hypothetical protein
MKKPCETCIVRPRCSQCCEDYAKFVYETENYKFAGPQVSLQIKEMSYEEAVQHILTVENVYLYLKNIHNQTGVKFTSEPL